MRRIALSVLFSLALISNALAQYTINPFAPTYAWFGVVSSIAVAPTDSFCIESPPTGAARVLYMAADGACSSATSAANGPIILRKRNTLNSGGTSTVEGPLNRDSRTAPSTVKFRLYTANPTVLGADGGSMDAQIALFRNAAGTNKTGGSTGGTPGGPDVTISGVTAFFDFRNGGPLVLNGPNEAVCIQPSAGFAGCSMKVRVVLQQTP